MRLYNTYYLCKQCQKNIEIKYTETKNNPTTYYIENWDEYKNTLLILRSISIFKELVDLTLEILPPYLSEVSRPHISTSMRNSLNAKKSQIITMVNTIVSLYESMGLEENRNGIDVLMPKCESLKQYTSYLGDLDFIFNNYPFIQHKEAMIKFNSVDVGSEWITFAIVSGTAVAVTGVATYVLSNLAALVDKAIQVTSHLKSLQAQQKALETLEVKSEILENTVESYELLRKYYISEAIKEIEASNENCKISDGEERGKAEKSLEKLSSLLESGMKIYSSIDTSQEVQVLFPPIDEMKEIPENVIKFIEQKIEE